MSADVVVGSYLASAIFDDEKGETSFCELGIVTGIWESAGVRDDKPLAGEYRSSLKIIHALRMIPRSWQSPNGLLFGRALDLRFGAK